MSSLHCPSATHVPLNTPTQPVNPFTYTDVYKTSPKVHRAKSLSLRMHVGVASKNLFSVGPKILWINVEKDPSGRKAPAIFDKVSFPNNLGICSP